MCVSLSSCGEVFYCSLTEDREGNYSIWLVLCVCYISNGEIHHSTHTSFYVMHDDSILQGMESCGGNEI